jgi:putative oxidoreductase
MADLKLGLEEHHSRLDTLATWLPRVAVAVAFFAIGADKFAAQSMWVRIFEQIGLGQWFRYFTGALQITGATMVLIPRTVPFGILLLASTMLGAIIAWAFVLHAAGNALIPAIVFAALLVVGAKSLVGLASGPRHE